MLLTQCDFLRSAPNANVVRISNKRGQTAGVTMSLSKRQPNVLISALSVKVNEIQTDLSKRWL